MVKKVKMCSEDGNCVRPRATFVENCIVLCNLRCRRLLEPKCYVFVFYVCVVLVLFVGMPSSLVVPVGPSSVLCSDASVW